MKKITGQIFREESLVHVEGSVAALEEVFRLQRVEELQDAEQKYLPGTSIDSDDPS
jgi:phosphoenolpyruvate phosphomutase